MKDKLLILLPLILVNIVNSRSLPHYDFNSNDIRRSHEVRQALSTNRFSVNRMNQFANTAYFAAISHECVALVEAKYDRFQPRPPHPRPPYPWPPHRPFFPGEVENGPEPAPPGVIEGEPDPTTPGAIEGGPEPVPAPIQNHNGIQSSSQMRNQRVGAINPDLYYDRHPYQSLRIYVTQVVCHNNPRVRPMPIAPIYNKGTR